MLNKNDFENIGKELKKFDAERENAIVVSRDVIRLSKRVIYACHRDDIKEAAKLVKEMIQKTSKLTRKDYDVGINKVAFQEYVEAVTFYEFVKNSRIPGFKELKVSPEDYLAGLADLSGELVRKAVHESIKKNHNMVFKIRDLVEEIYGEFLKFDLRNGELRKKSDAIKWNLNKIEDLVLTLSH